MWFALILFKIRASNTISPLIVLNFVVWPHGVLTLYKQMITTCVICLNVEHCLSLTNFCIVDAVHILWGRNCIFCHCKWTFSLNVFVCWPFYFVIFVTILCYLNHSIIIIIIIIIIKGAMFVPVTILAVDYDEACSRQWSSAEATGTDSKCQLESL